MNPNRNKKSYRIKTLFILILMFSTRFLLSESHVLLNISQPVDSFMIKVERDNKILDAVISNDVHKVSKYINGVDINVRISGGSTFLIEAIYSESREVIKFLLTKAADPNLRAAPFYNVNDEPILEESPLEASFEIEDAFDITKMLISYGANVNSKDAQGNTLLHAMLKSDERETTQEQTVQYVPDILYGNRDAGNNVTMHKVALYDKIKWLIKNGADINAVNQYGETPLLTAAWSRNYDCAELLLKSGADPKAMDSGGKTALFYCTSKAFAKKLIKKGAEINVQDNSGLTALHMAVFEGNIEIVKLFVQNGADVNMRDDDSKLTPLEWMIVDWYSGNYDLAKYLVSKGAEYNNNLVNQYSLTEEFYKIKKELGN